MTNHTYTTSMAPFASETVTVTRPGTATYKVHTGDYKEIFSLKFKEEDERNGTGEHAPASVSPFP